jgi:hypothetical protein
VKPALALLESQGRLFFQPLLGYTRFTRERVRSARSGGSMLLGTHALRALAALAGVGLALAPLSGCKRSGDASSDVVPPLVSTPVQPGAGPDPLGYEYRIGAADPCELLLGADPGALLGTEIGPPFRVYGLCRYEAKVWRKGEPERAIGLEMRREPQRAVPTRLDEFWLREGNGVDLMGAKRDDVVELPGLGDYALWYPTRQGLQLYAYWGEHNVLVLTIAGAPVEPSLPWAQALARKAIEKASAPVS